MKIVGMMLAASVSLASSMPAVAQDDFGFDINVTLSKKAAAKLAAHKEGIAAFAAYSGAPKKSAQKYVDEMGQIDVSPQEELIQIPGQGGHGHLSGKFVDSTALEWVDGEVSVNVNVLSARKSFPDNILTCDLIDGTVSAVKKKSPIAVHCSLIEENRETKTFP